MKPLKILFLLLVLNSTVGIYGCRLTKRERINLFDQQQLSGLNQTLQPLVQTDSLSVFEERTTSRRNEKLGDILYIRLYGSKNLPADNNQAEDLAKKVCNAVFPQIPSPRKYSLWKIQFATRHAEQETRLQKVFNFASSELNNP